MKLHNITKDQLTGRWLVKAKDTFLSGWGEAKSGASWCAWAFSDYEAAFAFSELLRQTTNLKYIGISRWPYRPRNAAHFSVYNGDSHVIKHGNFLAVQYDENIRRFRYITEPVEQ